jgi:hypothetical protein
MSSEDFRPVLAAQFRSWDMEDRAKEVEQMPNVHRLAVLHGLIEPKSDVVRRFGKGVLGTVGVIGLFWLATVAFILIEGVVTDASHANYAFEHTRDAFYWGSASGALIVGCLWAYSHLGAEDDRRKERLETDRREYWEELGKGRPESDQPD